MYLKFTEQHLQECTPTHYGSICPPKGPLFTISDQKEYEVELLLNPHPDVLKSCDIIISSFSTSQWRYLELTDSWLHSIAKEETIRITCPGETYFTPTIKGTGILRLANGCSTRTRSVELPDNQDQTTKAQYVYNPEVGLNITVMHPELWQPMNESIPLETGQFSSDTSFAPRTERLSSIVSRMKEIGEHKRNTSFTHHLIYGGITFQGVTIIIGVISFLLYRRTTGKRSKLKPRYTEKRDTAIMETPLTYVAIQPHPVPSRSASTPIPIQYALPPQLAELD